MARSLPLFLALALTLAAGACTAQGGDAGAQDDASAQDEAAPAQSASGGQGEALAVSETGWLTVGQDGAVQTTFFDTGGRYRDYRNGDLLGQGNWAQRPDGSLCFEPDSGPGACWITAAPDDTGTIIVTNEAGKRVEIRRITYVAPLATEPGDEGTGGQG